MRTVSKAKIVYGDCVGTCTSISNCNPVSKVKKLKIGKGISYMYEM